MNNQKRLKKNLKKFRLELLTTPSLSLDKHKNISLQNQISFCIFRSKMTKENDFLRN